MAAQSLAAAIATLMAVTGIVASDRRVAEHASTRGPMLSGVAMPRTGPADLPVRPLRVVVHFGRGSDERTRAEIDRLGEWLETDHGRARLAVVEGARATGLVDPKTIASAPRTTRASAAELLAVVPGRRAQRLLVTLARGPQVGSRGTTVLELRGRRGAAVLDDVMLDDGERLVREYDPRRRGMLAATIARGVISLADLREVGR